MQDFEVSQQDSQVDSRVLLEVDIKQLLYGLTHGCTHGASWAVGQPCQRRRRRFPKNFPAWGFYTRSEASQQDFKVSQQDSKVSQQDLKVQWDWTAFASLYTKDLVLGSALRGVCRFLCKN